MRKEGSHIPVKFILVFLDVKLKPSEARLKFRRKLQPFDSYKSIFFLDVLFKIINLYIFQGKCSSIVKITIYTI